VTRVLPAALLLALPLFAQPEPAPVPRRQAAELIADLQPLIVRFEPRDRLLYLVGGVDVRVGDIRVRCDSLLAWLADPEGLPPHEEGPPLPPAVAAAAGALRQRVHEIYAEGTVIFSQGEEWARAERLYFDFLRSRGLVIDATVAFPIQSRGEPTQLVVRAEELRFLSENRLSALGASATTCTFGHPHYHVGAAVIDVIRESTVAPPGRRPERPVNHHLEFTDPYLHVEGLGAVWLPDFVHDTARDRGLLRYVEDVRFDRSNRFGLNLGITVGDDIAAADGRVWGHWSVPLDWYSKRGPGAGVDLEWEDPDGAYRGRFRSRYLRDHGEDRFFGEPPTRNRGRLQLQHRHQLPYEVQLDLELALFSDRGYYPTFFESEDKGEKPPENLLYLKRAFFNSYLTALYTTRFNDWETVREYRPEIRFDLLTEPLFDIGGRPVYLSTTARVSENRLLVDEALDIAARATARADLDTVLEHPVALGPFTVTPFAGLRTTFYERDLAAGRDRTRVGFQHGATLTTQVWRTFDVAGGLFDLDGLRHVAYPEITFRNVTGVTVDPSELIPFDDVDAYDNLQVVEMRLRNLLQTVRARPGGPTVENFVDLELETAWFPNAGRDHGGEPWGNLVADLIVRFSDAFQVAVDLEYDWYGQRFEIFNAAAGYLPSREFQSYLGFRHFAETFDAVFVQANWRLAEKWMVTAELSYDFNDGRGLDNRLIFTRFGHDWVLQLGLRADTGENDYGISLSFEPRFLFDPVLRPGRIGSEPRLLYLGTGLDH
jgi:hypothetical protein